MADQPNWKPTNKVQANAYVMMGATVFAWFMSEFMGTDVPAEVALAIAGLVSLAVQWWTPDN